MDTTTYKIIRYNNEDDFNFDSDKIEIYDNAAQLTLQDGTNYYEQDYSNPDDFTYESDKAEFADDKIQQKSQDTTTDFSEDFADDTGFTYNASLAEFVAGYLKQKDLTPANSVLGANYNSSANANWGNGTLTATLGGSANAHDGYLDLTGGNAYLEYNTNNFASMSSSAGCIRFRIAFDYTGAASNVQYIMQTSPNTASRVYLVHNSTFIQCYITNTGSTTVYSMTFSWTPTQGVWYEFEVDWNTTNAYFFVNGVLQDSDTGSLGMAAPSLFRIGQGSNAKMKIDKLLVFNTLQHSSGYTPGFTVIDQKYSASSALCPTISYTYKPISITEPTITESGEPHYTINGYYYNGADWVASSDTYATAMTKAVWIANYDTFPSDQFSTDLEVRIYFDDTNTQGQVDYIDFDVNEVHYLTTNVTLPEMEHEGVGTLLVASEFSTEDYGEPRYTVQIDRSGDYLYWGGTEWIVSDGTYAQATNEDDFNDNIEDLPVSGATYGQFKIHFNAGLTQQWVDLTAIALLESIGYPTEAQKISLKTRFNASELISFGEKATKPANTGIKYTIEVDGQEKYWDGDSVETSDGTYAQANTYDDIDTNILQFISENEWVKLFAYLYTSDNQVTPYLETNTIQYYEAIEFRDSLNEILIFIGSETLTDAEYNALTIDEDSSDIDVYNALLDLLEERESVSSTKDQLYYYYLAKGVTVAEPEGYSNIYVGGSLED